MKKERVTVLDKIGCWETMAHPFNPGYIGFSHWRLLFPSSQAK
jgi:hypothetical protein